MGIAGGPLLPAQTLRQLRCGAQADLPQVRFLQITIEKSEHEAVKSVRGAVKVNYTKTRSKTAIRKGFYAVVTRGPFERFTCHSSGV
jgi:hypothetical protein